MREAAGRVGSCLGGAGSCLGGKLPSLGASRQLLLVPWVWCYFTPHGNPAMCTLQARTPA